MALNKTQVAIIGGGPGGYVAAFRAADAGLDVTLLDLDTNLGGVCLHRGCIPSKALLHVARLLTEARHATSWGVNFDEPRIDLDRLRSWKAGVVERMTRGLSQLVMSRKIHHIQGRARFIDAHTLRIDRDGDSLDLTFEHAVLASGSRPISLPVFDLDDGRVMDSTGALELADVPESLLVVGGGIVGLELGTVYAALGSRVSVVELTSQLVPAADRDLVKPLRNRLDNLFEDIMLNTTVVAARPSERGIEVDFRNEDDPSSQHTYTRVLVAVSRRPNSDDIGLESTKVDIDQHGYVLVDEQRRTAEPSIFAVGDVVGSALAHTASHEGRIAAEVIAGQKTVFEPNAIPSVVYTDPEIAWCGLTETEAAKQGRPVEITRFPWAASGRASAIDRIEGLTKMLVDPANQRVLGVGIVGPGASELIAEGVLSIEMAAVATDISLSIHPHPTLSETLMENAELFHGPSPHLYTPRR